GPGKRHHPHSAGNYLPRAGSFAAGVVPPHDLPGAGVVGESPGAPTPAGARPTLEGRRPFSRWTMPPIGAAGLRIVVQTTEVLVVLGPGDVAWVRVADQRMPLLARELHTPLGAMRRSVRLGLS